MNADIRKKNLEKVLKLLEVEQGLDTYAKINEKYKISTGYLSQVRNGKRQMGEKFARDLEQTLGLPEFYMDNPVDDNDKHLINQNSSKLKNYALGNIEPLSVNPNTQAQYAPVLNYVQAGLFADIGDNDYDEYLAFNNDKVSDNAYWLIVKGDSMTPDFQEGDLLLVDADRQPKSGNYVIAKVADDNEATFKRYKACGFDDKLKVEYFQLTALNEFYSPIDSRYKSFVVLGVVMEHKRRFYV